MRATIPPETLQKYRTEVLSELKKTAKLDGFRPGHVPEDRILQVYGEPTILKQAAEHAIEHELPEILAEEKQLVVAAPRVSMEPPSTDKAASFTARAPLAPQVILPDYKEIAKKENAKKEEVLVSDEEHTQTLTHLRRERARIDKMESGSDPKKAHEESRAMEEKDLPALDDAFVQSLGYGNAEKFSEAVRGNIKNEKEMQAREKRRAALLEALLNKTTIHYPAFLREYEIDDIEARMKEEITRSGGSWEGYLAETKKTPEEFRATLTDAGDKRARVRLILSEIARKESVEADPEKVAHELEHATKHYPQADKESLRAHIVHALRNEKVIEMLEAIS